MATMSARPKRSLLTQGGRRRQFPASAGPLEVGPWEWGQSLQSRKELWHAGSPLDTNATAPSLVGAVWTGISILFYLPNVLPCAKGVTVFSWNPDNDL